MIVYILHVTSHMYVATEGTNDGEYIQSFLRGKKHMFNLWRGKEIHANYKLWLLKVLMMCSWLKRLQQMGHTVVSPQSFFFNGKHVSIICLLNSIC